ncbi:MAG: transglutaminase domain-containing protein [Planctomycetota bacterium]
MQSKSSLTGPTYVLIAIATAMLQLALFDRQGIVPHEWVQLAFVFVLALVIRRSESRDNQRAGNVVPMLCFVVMAALPFVADDVQRVTTRFGNPFEIQLVLGLRNLMIGLAARNRNSRSLMFATLASGFLALYSFLWLLNRWTIALVFVYAIVGMWWLMGTYWDRLSGCFLSRSERQVPWKPILGASAAGVLIGLAALPLALGKNYTTAIQGFMPSSGGTGGQDEHAFGGVGDGPQMVSAQEDASSFGPIESELFLESKMPSLYDVMNEFSDAPPKPKKRGRQRAIPLAPSQMKANHERKGTNQRPAREFSAVRRQKQETPKAKDLRSRALLQVIGRTPVHLGLYAYDTWNGRELSTSGQSPALALKLERDVKDNRNWARFVSKLPKAVLSHTDRHEIRIINLKTDRVPSPPSLSGVNIDKLHSAKLFQVADDGMLAADMDFIPQLSILHLESKCYSAARRPLLTKRVPSVSTDEVSLARLAQSWTDGLERGWPQVEAICTRLQKEYALDASAMVPVDVDDAATYFLMEAKRGPDYLFATSAALLLRTLGYEARVISGFYADPKNYDRQSRSTCVYADDAHFWVEVLADPGSSGGKGTGLLGREYWVAVDPSPGYEVLLAPQSLWSKWFARVSTTLYALKRNPLITCLVAATIAISWKLKSSLLDLIVTVWWLLAYRAGDLQQRVRSTVRLLERRAALHGCPRKSGVPLGRWCQTITPLNEYIDAWQEPFVEVANWALYGDKTNCGYSGEEIHALCKQAAAVGMQPQTSWLRGKSLLAGEAR